MWITKLLLLLLGVGMVNYDGFVDFVQNWDFGLLFCMDFNVDNNEDLGCVLMIGG